ncbi:hypothetical protein [Pseudophaeobacter sp.]|uniref:hypothetical protein n=1 Tax=Pseudophaeobacter sp. TaxID=1971739 RepID=UPI0032984159
MSRHNKIPAGPIKKAQAKASKVMADDKMRLPLVSGLFRILAPATIFLAALGLSASTALAADWTDVHDEAEAYDVCTAYVMADLEFFIYNNPEGDMDLAFEEAVVDFATVAYQKQHGELPPSYIERKAYERELSSMMLGIFLDMRDAAEDSANLDELQSFCTTIGAKHEQTRWVFQ